MNQESRDWKVGDLAEYEYDGETLLILLLLVNPMKWINEVGNAGVLRYSFKPKFLHNTGLRYDYYGNPKAEVDFKNGVFTPYFEIL